MKTKAEKKKELEDAGMVFQMAPVTKTRVRELYRAIIGSDEVGRSFSIGDLVEEMYKRYGG